MGRGSIRFQVLRLPFQNFQLWPGLMSGILFSGTGLHKARLTFCPLQQQWNASKYFVLWSVPLAVDQSLSVFVSLLSPDCFLAISIINSIDSFGRIKKNHLMQNSAFSLLINQYWVISTGCLHMACMWFCEVQSCSLGKGRNKLHQTTHVQSIKGRERPVHQLDISQDANQH